jgi:hypothetical protein
MLTAEAPKTLHESKPAMGSPMYAAKQQTGRQISFEKSLEICTKCLNLLYSFRIRRSPSSVGAFHLFKRCSFKLSVAFLEAGFTAGLEDAAAVVGAAAAAAAAAGVSVATATFSELRLKDEV